MRKYWRGICIGDIKAISGIGGRFGEETYTYFNIRMKDKKVITLYFEDVNAYKHRRELKSLFNEYHKIPESYLLENNIHIRVNGEIILFGCRVEDNLDDYVYKTLIELDELKSEGKIRDEGWRHMLFICPLEIENGKVIRGTITDQWQRQLDHMGIKVL
ncbi:hypothetical protein C4A75_09520 [Brevibacillus laterosporus]|uniref:Uncharacterized protein n=1 Tax=Brevibacillus laterosporus TaxID=1465 RepID=A0AAP8QHU2_BRELA|nr:hypothetical protein [Brevibacillus laterosporus]PPA85006.1 hypothetical protein C4A75_09520 [Brevibacillus laterosporus]PPB12894.1 hypothetical protein C4A77_00475 [Brevibacillus laterosporus]